MGVANQYFTTLDPQGERVRIPLERVVDGALAAWEKAHPGKSYRSAEYVPFVQEWAHKHAWKLHPSVGLA